MKKSKPNTEKKFKDFLNGPLEISQNTKITYKFFNHFHPYVGELIEQLNKKSLAGLFDVDFQSKLVNDFFQATYQPNTADPTLKVKYSRTKKELDLRHDGSYSIYNWELFFHIPLMIAVNLSKNQRFAEAQKWFHYIFDPTSTDKSIKPPMRFWKFRNFRKKTDIQLINELLKNLSDTKDNDQKEEVIESIKEWRNNPFQPHVIARNRILAYQFNVVFEYLNNLIRWGDSLFRQDTIETLNEATQIYILAANILGPRPQKVPSLGKPRPKTFAMLKRKLDAFGNAMVDLEGQFPINLDDTPTNVDTSITYNSNVLFGITRTLYFCIPRNDKLLEYWDLVGDRLFKIRHCMNIEGVARQLPLFEPPLDPGMLVKAVAAGIDISSLVSGLNQPISLVRFPFLIQKALEICGEVKNLGNMLLSAVEKKDGEELAILRQGHELKILQMVQDVKYFQWKDAESATESLLKTRESTFQRYRHYQLLLGKKENDLKDIQNINIENNELNEENFDQTYSQLVEKYAKPITLENYRTEQSIDEGNNLQLNKSENAELNVHMPRAHDLQQEAGIVDAVASYLSLIPQFDASARPGGVGGGVDFGGQQLSTYASFIAKIIRNDADDESYQANRASKFAAYQRRIEDWILQSNVTASELVQIGRQIISSLIREQLAKKEYENHKRQIENAQEIDIFMKELKFTNKDLYGWMQGEISKIYYECYKFAFDIAKKTEQTMKHEVMREELDDMTFIKLNYWDSGRKGLLSGEALYLDLKRMEMAYHDYNRREYEIVKHVSIMQLDPKALLKLKATGSCEITIPEWLFDMDCPGHYMRRIKSVSISIPCVVGPYASVNCTLSLLKSSVRTSPLLLDGEYSRKTSGEDGNGGDGDDNRFKDYFGTIESIVTSSAQNDSGLFERNLRDERYLPFEGAGAVDSTWKLEIPIDFKQFDLNTISDAILHMMYSARNGGEVLKSGSVEHLESIIKSEITSSSSFGGLTNTFSLKHNFPSEWYKFKSSSSSTTNEPLKITIKKDHFPYLAQNFNVNVVSVDLFAINDKELLRRSINDGNVIEALNDGLNGEQHQSELEITSDTNVLNRENDHVFLIVSYFLE